MRGLANGTGRSALASSTTSSPDVAGLSGSYYEGGGGGPGHVVINITVQAVPV